MRNGPGVKFGVRMEALLCCHLLEHLHAHKIDSYGEVFFSNMFVTCSICTFYEACCEAIVMAANLHLLCQVASILFCSLRQKSMLLSLTALQFHIFLKEIAVLKA